MNILHLITSLKVGGAETALVNYLSKVIDHKIIGHDGNTHLVAYFHHGPNADKIRDLGVKIYQVSGVFSIYDPVFFFRLAKLIKFIKPDIIHSSLWSANISARLVSKFYKIPVICDLHGNSFDEGKLRNWFDRRTVNYCAKIVAVSDSVKDAYLKNIIGVNCSACSKLVVIKNGIDVKHKACVAPLTRKDFGLLPSDFVVGAVGRLEPIKSYDILVRAFARFLRDNNAARAKLVIVGDGSQRQMLEDLAKSLNIEEHVVFTGFRHDAYKIYPIFDCFALSSQSEGLSIALLEAMAFSLPVITTNLDSSRHDVIKPGINGFLVCPNDIESYANAINKFFSNREMARGIGLNNAKLVRSDFCIDGVVDGYQKLYQSAHEDFLSKKL
jgi:glycosyltransferase involved in cell wall biosynthesis